MDVANPRLNNELRIGNGDVVAFYWSLERQVQYGDPEVKIRFACLVGAILDLNLESDPDRSRAASRWFKGLGKSAPTFSFREVCETLRIDPDYFKTGKLKDPQLARLLKTHYGTSESLED